MFLDEELEKIYKEYKNNSMERSNIMIKECSDMMIKAMVSRLKESDDPEIFLTTLKQIDNSWRLFAKRNKDINSDAWREFVKSHDKEGKIIKALNW